jgi:hypothetical protein
VGAVNLPHPLLQPSFQQVLSTWRSRTLVTATRKKTEKGKINLEDKPDIKRAVFPKRDM